MTTVAYLDNNATTLMPESVVRELAKWTNQGNPSASYASAKHCQAMMNDFRATVARAVGCSLASYAVIFTSGATEANCMIVRGVIERARRARGFAATVSPFHVVSSAIEHKSIILLLEDAVRSIPEMSLTLIHPDSMGHMHTKDFVDALRPATKLVICMHGNNETGAINDIAEIGRQVKRASPDVFFHSDIVQTFGKIPVNLSLAKVDGASISFHKLHGPPGVGAAIIKRASMNGIPPLLYGTQSFGMRGGTENVIGLGAAFAATTLTLAQQPQTIARELQLKSRIVSTLAERAPVTTLQKYLPAKEKLELQIVIIGSDNFLDPTQYLPGTIMLAVAKHVGPPACNSLIKEKLESERVIVSVGSACNTASSEHSHVLRAMKIPTIVMDGAIRVSMCGYSTESEIDRFVSGFINEANRQYQTARK